MFNYLLKNDMKSFILLVEDDTFVSKAYLFMLKNAGFDVIYAQSAEEGLKIIDKKKPLLILLDLIMPGMNGFEMLSILKKNKKSNDIPVIIISNLGQQSDILECKRLGATDYLIKSNLSMKEVISKINLYIKN